MDFRQLELELDELFEDAAETPEIADIKALWQQLEPMLSELSMRDRLRLSSQVIDQLAGLHQAKAQWLLDEWENTYDPQDPNVPGDWLQGFIRQSQHVDLADLTAPVQRRPRTASGKPKKQQGTVVGEVPKENVLKMLDAVELAEQKATAISVAHEERIEDWVTEIHAWFDQHPQPIPLPDLQQALDWPLVQLWLSLLLGGFKLEAINSPFYSDQILISEYSA